MSGYEMLLEMSELDEDLIREAKDGSVKKPVRFRWILSIAAALFICITVSVPALVMAGNEQMYDLLYKITPEMAQKLKPVNMTCEDKGIQMTVLAANIEGEEADILIAFKDTEQNRLDGSTDLFDSYSIHTPYDQAAGCDLAGYDEENGELTYMITVEQMDHVLIPGDKITFSVRRLLSGKKHYDMRIDRIDTVGMPEVSDCMDVPDLRGMSRKDIDENMRFIVPSDEWVTLGDGVMLTGYGLVDGKLHVQLLYEDIANTDNHGYVYLVKGEEDKIIEEGSYSWYDDEENSFQEYVFSIPADELADYQVWGEFWTCSAGAIDGEWSITFPLE